MSEENSMIKCSNCNEPLEAHWDECPSCSTPTSAVELTCPNCQSPVKERWKICPKCKMPLTGTETPPESTTSSSIGTDIKQSQMVVSMMGDQAGGETAHNIELPLNEGDVLADKYRIVRPLGKGGFGAVYQVTDSVLNEDVALKIVVTGQGKAGNATEQLLHEFKLRDKIIDIDHVIRAQDPRPCEYKGLSLILLPMELADGGSMRKWLQQNKDLEKRQETGIDLFKQACLGVKAIHDAGLVHLDLKPENILLVDGKAKIADFGLGRFGAGQFASNPDQLLQQGIGTPQYMSPEQFQVARQKDIKAVSDIYSLGIILFELLDGSRPFDGKPHELKEKHLNMAPPQLAAKLELWGQIISRCLAKDPQNRYPSIEHLINDLDRAAKGATLSIDVSCPKCGHINDNQDVKFCQKCHADLDSLFRPCPGCGRPVRLDIETCPICKTNVAGHYLLLERKDRIARLKDEDPAEAIELLETVLQDGAGDYCQDALELVKDLRRKLLEIGELTTQATDALSSGQPEAAIKKWRAVLRVIPRHRHALKHIQETESLLNNFRMHWKHIPQLMDEANFEKADSLLQQCLVLIPARDEIREMLNTCRQRADAYSQAYDRASRFTREKQTEEAIRELDLALSQAPKSADALAMVRQLSKIADEIGLLFRQAQRQLDRAGFADVEKSIASIEELQTPNRDLHDLQLDFAMKRDDYIKAMEESQIAKDDRDLVKAAREASSALATCCQSQQAEALLAQINAEQEKARQLLAKVQGVVISAKFDDAEAMLLQVESIWLHAEGLQTEKNALAKCRKDYTGRMESARDSYGRKDLTSAMEAAQSALLICCDSLEASDFIASIQGDKDGVDNCLRDMKKCLLAAEFDEARALLNQARLLWATHKTLQPMEGEIASKETQYLSAMTNAREAYDRRDLDSAIKAGMSARQICRDSTEASKFIESVEKAQSRVRTHFDNAKTLVGAAKFEEAKQQLDEARQLWPACGELAEMEDIISSASKQYQAHMDKAKKQLNRKEYYDALDESELALRQCPNSDEALSLRDRIRAESKNALRREVHSGRRRRNVKRLILRVIIGAIILAVVGAILWGAKIGAVSLWPWFTKAAWPYCADHKKSVIIIGVAVALVTAAIHGTRFTNLYVPFFRIKNSDSPGALIVWIVMCFLCAIPGIGLWVLYKYVFTSWNPDFILALGRVISVPTSVILMLHASFSKCRYRRVKK